MSTQYDDPTSAIDLSQFDDQYEQAQVSDRTAKVPDGKYHARVDKVELKTTQKGAPMLTWDLEIVGPAQIGRHLFTNNVLSGNSTGLSILKSNLAMCRLELAKLSDLPNRLSELLDVVLEVQAKTKPAANPTERDNQNVYFNKYLGKGEDYEGASGNAGVNLDRDIPF